MGETVSIQPPLIPFSKLHHQDEVPMATKHESVSMRMQGLAESMLQTSQSKSGGRLYCHGLTLVSPSDVTYNELFVRLLSLSQHLPETKGPGQHPLMAQRRLAAHPSTSKSPSCPCPSCFHPQRPTQSCQLGEECPGLLLLSAVDTDWGGAGVCVIDG